MEININEIEKRKKITDWFNSVMLTKLLLRADKGDWNILSIDKLLKLLEKEIIELKEAIIKGSHKEVILEAADIANYAMFIADNIRR